jgi:hypothetical protein
MLPTTCSNTQEILKRYELIWDVVVPTTDELYSLFSELGTVKPSQVKKTRFAVELSTGAIQFNNREDAWDWYLIHAEIYKPVQLPWKLPSVVDQAQSELNQYLEQLANEIAPEVKRVQYKINHLPTCEFHYQGTYAGNASKGLDGLWYASITDLGEQTYNSLDEAEVAIIEWFKTYLQRVTENPVASPELKAFAQSRLAS